MNRILRLTIVLLALSPAVFAADLSGSVIGISDGDTFTLLTVEKRQIKIRLAEIDAPESGQPYGNKSKQALSGLIFGGDVRVVVQTTDRYGRTVGRPYVGDLDICAEMVRMGAAWVYKQYLVDRSLFDVEKDARAAKRGIWGLPESEQVEPWNWRRGLNVSGKTPEGCNIKGNINSKGDHIYHAPGTRSYGATKINESKGERWFCTEDEATTAGWRAPKH